MYTQLTKILRLDNSVTRDLVVTEDAMIVACVTINSLHLSTLNPSLLMDSVLLLVSSSICGSGPML
jgi:hypothetical protein